MEELKKMSKVCIFTNSLQVFKNIFAKHKWEEMWMLLTVVTLIFSTDLPSIYYVGTVLDTVGDRKEIK